MKPSPARRTHHVQTPSSITFRPGLGIFEKLRQNLESAKNQSAPARIVPRRESACKLAKGFGLNPQDAEPRGETPLESTAPDSPAPDETSVPLPPAKLAPGTVEELYKQYAGELRLFLIGLLRNGDVAEDVLQTVFTRTLDSGHSANDATRRGWLFRVAYHEAMLRKRKESIESRSLHELARRANEAELSADESAIRSENAIRVRDALARLPDAQRQVVWMRIHHGQTFRAIAEELQLPLGTVLTRMRLGLAQLARVLKHR